MPFWQRLLITLLAILAVSFVAGLLWQSILGFALPSYAAGIIGGVLIGGLLGGAIGNALDQKDKEMAAQAAHRAFENSRSGESSAWQNPDSGNSGSITPTRTYQVPDGRYCREYQQDIVVGGKSEKSYGTACRQPDGTWQIQG